MTLFLLCFFQLTEAVLNGILANPTDVATSAFLLSSFQHEQLRCSGVVIAEELVLTSKHCLYKDGNRAYGVEVNVGEYDRNNRMRREATVLTLIEIPESDHETNDDLALLLIRPVRGLCEANGPRIAQLPPSLTFTNQPYSQAFISDKELETAVCSATGWGITERNVFSRYPMTVFVHLSYEEFGYGRPVLLATYHSPETRFCAGDSGSPVFCWLRGSRYLVGLLSEIGGETPADPRKNFTVAEKCAMRDFVQVTDLRYRLGEIAAMFPGQLTEGQQLCGLL